MTHEKISDAAALMTILDYCIEENISVREFIEITGMILSEKIVVRVSHGWKLKRIRFFVRHVNKSKNLVCEHESRERPHGFGKHPTGEQPDGYTEHHVIKYTWVRRKR